MSRPRSYVNLPILMIGIVLALPISYAIAQSINGVPNQSVVYSAPANSIFGNFTGSTGVPGFSATPVFSAATLTNFPGAGINTAIQGLAGCGTSGYVYTPAGSDCVSAGTATNATNLAGGALGSIPYQNAAATTLFVSSPTTAGTYLMGWQPSGSAIAPAALSMATLHASPGPIGITTPSTGAFTTETSTSHVTTPATVTASSTPALVATNSLQAITLSANATPTISGIVAGQHVTFQICQPSSGGPYTWTWPAAVHGGVTVGTTASTCSTQDFVSVSGTTLVATDSGAINVAP